jgi:vacuolar-type H+-ATPase subunit I/STV1
MDMTVSEISSYIKIWHILLASGVILFILAVLFVIMHFQNKK